MSLKKYLKEVSSRNKYYRVIKEFRGKKTIFNPEGYYESFDDDGSPVVQTGDIMMRSNIPEVSASKRIGGALLGLWSMLKHYDANTLNEKIFVYSITDKPDKDLSDIIMDDFEYIKEVRYKNPVEGTYEGYYIYDTEFDDGAELLYERLTQEPWDEFDEDQAEMFDDFITLIETIDEKHLKM